MKRPPKKYIFEYPFSKHLFCSSALGSKIITLSKLESLSLPTVLMTSISANYIFPFAFRFKKSACWQLYINSLFLPKTANK